jgi:tRNA pseudouridine38-40 synthase
MQSEEKQRIALVLEYDGGGLCGWQRQDNGPSVQQHLESALAGIEGGAVDCIAAGRTDAGVHAEAMLVHADVDPGRLARSPLAYVHGVNQSLPEQIRVLGLRAVGDDFHARFSCLERAYRYQIWNRRTAPAIERWRHWWMPRPLDVDAMQQAADLLVGRHDFSSFRASGCQAGTPVRELRELTVRRHGHCIRIHVRADAFLYHMVRNLAGTLVRVGIGRWEAEQVRELLSARDRSQAADTAPAHGLYFTNATYADFDAASLVDAV